MKGSFLRQDSCKSVVLQRQVGVSALSNDRDKPCCLHLFEMMRGGAGNPAAKMGLRKRGAGAVMNGDIMHTALQCVRTQPAVGVGNL